MAKNKTEISFEIEEDHAEWLAENTSEFGLDDESKAIRVLIDFAMEEMEAEDIFSPENMRCRHCG